jgi:hypothetical protein
MSRGTSTQAPRFGLAKEPLLPCDLVELSVLGDFHGKILGKSGTSGVFNHWVVENPWENLI